MNKGCWLIKDGKKVAAVSTSKGNIKEIKEAPPSKKKPDTKAGE